MGDFSIIFRGNTFLIILFGLAGIVAALLFYRVTLPPLPPRRRWLLTALRALALGALLLLLFEPILRIVDREQQPAVLAILADNSQSMTINDHAGDRAAQTRSWLRSARSEISPPAAQSNMYPFDSRLRGARSAEDDSLDFSGEVTDLSRAISELKEEAFEGNVKAAVLISDGNYTVGKNPVYDAEALGIPIYVVGVGDTTEQKDILVDKVMTNQLAYAETRVPFEISIKSSGYTNEKVEVTLEEGGTALDRGIVQLKEGTAVYPIRLFAEPKEEGMRKYTVRVSSLEGELTGRNNLQSVFVKVLKSRLRIVMFAGGPSPDVASVRSILWEDRHFDVQAFVQRSANDFYEGTPGRASLDSADCFVLIGFPGQATNPQMVQSIVDIVRTKRIPVLFIASRSLDFSKLQGLATFLPFSWSEVRRQEAAVFPTVPESKKSHPLVTLGGSMTAESWQELPPVYKTQTAFRVKPEAEALAFATLQGIALNDPLVSIRNINRYKSFAITAGAVWQWRLLAQGNSRTSNFFRELLGNAVRWLTTTQDDRNVRVAPTQESFTTAEPVTFTGQVYDDQLQPVDDAKVNIEIRRGERTVETVLHSVGNGLYEGSAESFGEGDYTFTARATGDGISYGDDKGRFSVGQMNVEFLETKRNSEVLRQVASRSGGKYYDIADAGGIKEDIASAVSFESKELVHASEIELWNWQYLLGLIIILLAAEWFIRKRNGMM